MRFPAAVAVSLSAATIASAAPMYRVTDLHTTGAFDLAADGTVYVNNGDYTAAHAETYSTIRGGTWGKLALPTGTRVTDVSDHGVILGASPTLHDFVQTPDGRRRLLRPAAGALRTRPLMINDSGVAAGIAYYSSVASLVTWPAATATLSHTAVDGIGGFSNTGVTAVQTHTKSGRSPALAKDGVITRLPGPTQLDSFGMDLNGRGALAGLIVDRTTATSVAAIWTASSLRKIAPLPGDTATSLSALNDSGVAVGSSSRSGLRATIWDGTALSDLNTRVSAAGVKLTYAFDINNAGQILVQGTMNGRGDFFLLTPMKAATATAGATASIQLRSTLAAVPEPSTLTAVAGVGLLARRRRRSS